MYAYPGFHASAVTEACMDSGSGMSGQSAPV